MAADKQREKDSILKRYSNFRDLSRRDKEGVDFRVRLLERRSPILIMSPHGGKIEPGTSEIAEAIAGHDFSFYSFEGLKKGDNRLLHISSTYFDEPKALAIVGYSDTVITIHGLREKSQFVSVGGLDETLKKAAVFELKAVGFRVNPPGERSFPAKSSSNICNRGKLGRGLQIEISRGIRDRFDSDPAAFQNFVKAVRRAIISAV